MAVPRKKLSKSRRRRRHGMWQRVNLKRLSKYSVAKCGQCGADKLSHRICPSCGYYKGKQVLTIKSKEKTEVLDA